jgi:hypothetical protein
MLKKGRLNKTGWKSSTGSGGLLYFGLDPGSKNLYFKAKQQINIF